ncbi:MAG: tetratricopeptide repeat protein [Planctomycetales bacterium]|nr:tetratricopeptide repeat protein [Planctomycetales bacterium]
MTRLRVFLLLFVAAIGLTSTSYITGLYLQSLEARQLSEARKSLQAVLKSETVEDRTRNATVCVRLSQSLIQKRSGLPSATASLYALSVVPLAHVTTNALAPPVEVIEKLSTVDLLLISEVFFKTRQFASADQLLALLLSRSDDRREEILRLACRVRLELGRDEEVLRYCDELAALDPTSPEPYRTKATVHRRHGRWELHVESVKRALANLEQSDAVLQIELIDGYVRLGRFGEARTEFDRFAASNPELVEHVPTMHASLLIQEGKREDADKILTEYLKIDPKDSEALVIKGKLLVGEQKFDDAIKVLQDALEQEPSSEDACFQLGQAYARIGQESLADEYLGRHQKLLDSKVRLYGLEQQAARNPNDVAIRREIAQLYASIELHELAAFWTRAANTAEGE